MVTLKGPLPPQALPAHRRSERTKGAKLRIKVCQTPPLLCCSAGFVCSVLIPPARHGEVTRKGARSPWAAPAGVKQCLVVVPPPHLHVLRFYTHAASTYVTVRDERQRQIGLCLNLSCLYKDVNQKALDTEGTCNS